MAINIGKTGTTTSIRATRNISVVFRGRTLETSGDIGVEYIVQERTWQKRPDRAVISLVPPFDLNIRLTKKAAEEGMLSRVLGFFVCPQTFRIGLDTKTFLYGSINEKVHFHIDGMPFIGKFFSGSLRSNTWLISLYTKDWYLLGEMKGPRLISYEDRQIAKQYIDMARPFEAPKQGNKVPGRL